MYDYLGQKSTKFIQFSFQWCHLLHPMINDVIYKIMEKLQSINTTAEVFIMLTSSVLNMESRMLPIAVLDPTPTTTALALPATTTVPWQLCMLKIMYPQ